MDFLRRRLSRLLRGDTPAAPFAAPAPAPEWQEWRRAAAALADGEPLTEPLIRALHQELAARAALVGADADWSPPKLSDLRVCKELPEWWAGNGNLLLRGFGSVSADPEPELGAYPPREALIVTGAGVQLHRVHAVGRNAVIAVGDGSNLYASTLSAGEASTIIVGHGTISTFDAKLNARNGGAVITGASGLWASGVRMFSDDMHAIRDLRTNRRLNERGGRIIIGSHVWIGEQVQFFGSSCVGADTVLGAGALVRAVTLPSNTVCVGRPARVVRRGTTWTLADEP